jgi:PAS domain S-box-containing protein
MIARPINILLVENDIADRVSVEQFVRNFSTRYRLDVVSSAAEAIGCLKKNTYDIALVDYRFKDGTAFDLLQKLGTIPAIFLTNPGQEEIAAMALERGAYDYLIKDAKKNYLMLLPGTVEKVLVRRQAEDALRESETRYKDLLEIVLDLYFCISDEGTVLLSNRAGAAKLGYTVSELLGAPLTRLVHPVDSEKVKHALLVAAAKPDEPHRVEFRLIRKDGGVVYVMAEVRAQPQRGKQIPVSRILARDITAARELDQKACKVAAPVHAPAITPRLSVPPVVSPVLAPAAPAAAPATDALRGTERLLIVDDTPEQRDISARMLNKLGYSVVTAEHGHAALELMKKKGDEPADQSSPFDLVILDMVMEKDFDGFDTYKKISELYPGQRCIIVSGGGITDRVKQAQALGAGQFIDKPYTFKVIGKAVRDELDRPLKS